MRFCQIGTRDGSISTPEVAARHHHRVGRGDDLLVRRQRLLLLDLGDHQLVAAGGGDQRLELAHVVGAAHEGERHVVDVLLEPPGEELAVGVGERADRQLGVGQVDALVRLDDAVVERLEHDGGRLDGAHPEGDGAVVDEDELSRPEVGEELREVDRRAPSPARCRARPRRRGGRATGRGRSPRRSFGPGRSISTASGEARPAAAARTSAMLRSCSARLPCDRLMRATSMPGLDQALEHAARRARPGPSVATILVRRRAAALQPGSSSCGDPCIVQASRCRQIGHSIGHTPRDHDRIFAAPGQQRVRGTSRGGEPHAARTCFAACIQTIGLRFRAGGRSKTRAFARPRRRPPDAVAVLLRCAGGPFAVDAATVPPQKEGKMDPNAPAGRRRVFPGDSRDSSSATGETRGERFARKAHRTRLYIYAGAAVALGRRTDRARDRQHRRRRDQLACSRFLVTGDEGLPDGWLVDGGGSGRRQGAEQQEREDDDERDDPVCFS